MLLKKRKYLLTDKNSIESGSLTKLSVQAEPQSTSSFMKTSKDSSYPMDTIRDDMSRTGDDLASEGRSNEMGSSCSGPKFMRVSLEGNQDSDRQ